jgi:transposase InsO family protein
MPSIARWCLDRFETGYDNGERVRIAFTLDCCDREAISWVATTGGLDSGDIRDLIGCLGSGKALIRILESAPTRR